MEKTCLIIITDPSIIPDELKDADGLRRVGMLDEEWMIYFIVRDGQVIYVGQTTQGNRRFVSHQRYKLGDTVLAIRMPITTSRDLDFHESKWIYKLKPKLNYARNQYGRCKTLNAPMSEDEFQLRLASDIVIQSPDTERRLNL